MNSKKKNSNSGMILALLTALAFTAGCNINPKVTVEADIPVTGITLGASQITLLSATTYQLTATVTPSDADNPAYAWSSDNETVATVDQTGLVTAGTPGSASITVTTEDGGFTARCAVDVFDGAVTGVTLDSEVIELIIDDTMQLSATIVPAVAINKNMTWSAEPSGIVEVSATGMVTALAKGTATVTVTTEDGDHTAQCSVIVDDRAVDSVSLDVSVADVVLGSSIQLTAQVLPSYASNNAVTWSSDPAGIVTVSNDGTVTGIALGTTDVTVTTVDGGFEDVCTVTVTPVLVTSVNLDTTPRIFHPTDAFQLTAVISPANATNTAVSYASSNEDALAVDPDGNLTFEGTGQTTITVTTADGGFTDTCHIIACTEDAFISVWNMSSTQNLMLPLYVNGTYDFTVDWGDGTSVSYVNHNAEHDFSTTGVYMVVIEGTVEGFGWESSINTNQDDLVDIMQWGSVILHNRGYQFSGCENLTGFSAEDVPDLSSVTTMQRMFENATLFNGDISGWDTSSVTNMGSMLWNAEAFNCDISDWNTSSVTLMSSMFQSAASFDQPIGDWDMTSVENISGMFKSATSFNQDLSEWETGSIIRMAETFSDTDMFNQDISDWDTSNVITMMNMFWANNAFDQDLSEWDVSAVGNMDRMFCFASVYTNGGNPGGLEDWTLDETCTTTDMFMNCPITPLPSWF